MKGAKGFAASLKFAQSFLLTRNAPARSLHSQVTRYSHLPPFPFSLSKPRVFDNSFLNTNQNLYFSSTPNSIVELVATNEWSEDLEEKLENSHSTLSHETVLYVLKKLEKNPPKALNFFNWISEKQGFKPSPMVYSLMLRILGTKDSMKEFWVLIKRMSEKDCDLDEETYVTVLANLKSESDSILKNCDALISLNKVTRESATAATVKHAANVILKSDWNDNVKKKLRELKITLSENSILRIFRELREYPFKALSFFRWVGKDMDYTHNTVTYNGVLRVLGQQKSIKEFWCLVKEMKSAGHDIDMDTYIKLSKQFQKAGMLKDAVKLYELMMKSPYKPLIGNCSSLLRELSLPNSPDVDLLFRVFDKCETMEYTFSKAIYDCIRKSFTTVGRFEEAQKVLETMRNAGFEVDTNS